MKGEHITIPLEIQCPADPFKVCPLRQAEHEMAELKQTYPSPPAQPESRKFYDTEKQRIMSSLSLDDKTRLRSMQSKSTPIGRTEIIPGSCVSGPEKSMIFFGKMACGAQTEFNPWQFPPIEPFI